LLAPTIRKKGIYPTNPAVDGYYIPSFLCPANPRPIWSYSLYPVLNDYSYNVFLGRKESFHASRPETWGIPTSSTKNYRPDRTVVFTDCWSDVLDAWSASAARGGGATFFRVITRSFSSYKYHTNVGAWAAHPGGMTVSHIDGHVAVQNYLWSWSVFRLCRCLGHDVGSQPPQMDRPALIQAAEYQPAASDNFPAGGSNWPCAAAARQWYFPIPAI
ncbi:MAG: hypothetical protein GX564_01170, partial [Oligosphaeraceae bacterium]|nr:hypothetical protein [Oligosphaeraceae bacterium]